MGAWTGAFTSRDSHQVTFGDLGGANLGALVGYGLVKTDLVDPRDFGWLSLAGPEPAARAPCTAAQARPVAAHPGQAPRLKNPIRRSYA
jgi:hypothetical protein